jgi:hypothetical protein
MRKLMTIHSEKNRYILMFYVSQFYDFLFLRILNNLLRTGILK